MSQEKGASEAATSKSADQNDQPDYTPDPDEAYEAYKDAAMRFGDGGCWGVME